MRIDIHIHHHNDPTVEDALMTVAAEIQSLIDQVKANTSMEESADLALRALSAQIGDLGVQIAALQEQITRGGSLHPDDIAALAQAQADLAASASKLQGDIPANVTPAPAPAPVATPAPQEPLPLDMNGNPPVAPAV